MTTDRINYLFSEKYFDKTRDLYRTILIAACKEASRLASHFTRYREPLTHYVCSFDLNALIEHMPVVESAIMPGRFKSQYSLPEILEALEYLHKAGYIMAEDKYHREIQLEKHLFKMVAEAWAESMGVKNWGTIDNPVYVTSANRWSQVEDVRYSLELRVKARKEGVAA